MLILETERLVLRELSLEDDAFMLTLLNEPSFLQFIGDRGVRTLKDARHYITTGPMVSYETLGLGPWLVVLKETGAKIGICGLLKRESLPDVDLGYALLPAYWSKGYAYESAHAVLVYGRDVLGVTRILAFTNPDNAPSIRLLEKLGLRFDRMFSFKDDEPLLKLFSTP